METLEQCSDLDQFTHDCAHREFTRLLAAFTGLPDFEALERFEIEPRVRQRLREIRNDLCYSSHEGEVWEIVKFRVKGSISDLQAAYLTAGLLSREVCKKSK